MNTFDLPTLAPFLVPALVIILLVVAAATLLFRFVRSDRPSPPPPPSGSATWNADGLPSSPYATTMAAAELQLISALR
ncbi:hypothetical protein [Arthrobacter sp. H41]|uniref:hypothetical protein n=1 Tax=Arthrobacter sp. H41 TaxID=1312978 RepID=UPI00047D6964|nr:hypothetical protein [Arthrobacter sp. H41]